MKKKSLKWIRGLRDEKCVAISIINNQIMVLSVVDLQKRKLKIVGDFCFSNVQLP